MAQIRKIGSIWIAFIVLAFGLPGTAAAATDLSQSSGTAGCVSEAGSSGLCQDGRGLIGTESIALSPDGADAYVASSGWDSVSVLARNTGSGALEPISSTEGCLDSVEVAYPECTPGRELGGASDVVVSPDGKNVYVAAPSDDAVDVLDRSPTSGVLTQSATASGCVNEDGSESCADGRALEGATALAISPDGGSLYVASSGEGGGIAVFDRDPTTGALTQKAGAAGCVSPSATSSGCAVGHTQLLDARAIQVSPDGKTVYVVSRTHDALTIYDRAADGQLTTKPGTAGCIDEAGENGCADGRALISPAGVTVSPDGQTVYVAAERSDAIAIFDRDTASGELSQRSGTAGCISNTGFSDPMQAGTAGECLDGAAMDGVDSIAIPADGSALYATAGDSQGVDVFERNADGSLAQRPGAEGCITDSGKEDVNFPWTAGYCGDGRALVDANRVIASADGRFVYTAAVTGGIGVFDVVEPPAPAILPLPPQQPAVSAGPPSPDCVNARADQLRAKQGLRFEEGRVRHLSHIEVGPRTRDWTRHELNRHRRLAGLWKSRLRVAEREVLGAC